MTEVEEFLRLSDDFGWLLDWRWHAAKRSVIVVQLEAFDCRFMPRIRRLSLRKIDIRIIIVDYECSYRRSKRF